MMSDDNLNTEQTDKLIHFQEVTHIDSIDECRQILEAHNWNIELAVQSTFNDPIENNYQQIPHETNAATNNTPDIDTFNTQINRDYIDTSLNSVNRLTNNDNSFSQLPNVNILTQRSLSYHNQIVPRGFFQWAYFIVIFPFRILYATLVELFGFFWKLFGPNQTQINYDPIANITEFTNDFNQKYGAENHPIFFQGSYSQAVNQAKKDLKFLLIYLHENDNLDCDKFATETLGDRNVIEFLNSSILLWACEKNLPEGKKVFLALKAKRCPFLGLIVLRANKMTLVSRIEGPISPGELILQLSQMISDFEGELTATRLEREQYNQNQRLREMQDEAYAESLRMDQEKARKQREIEEAKNKALEEEKKQLEYEKKKAQELINLKNKLKNELEEQPDASDSNAIKLLLKLPNGRRLERLFLKTDPAKNLYNFLFCNDECPTNFEIVTNFPRKRIDCKHDTDIPLQEFGINQSMLLFVNDLDA